MALDVDLVLNNQLWTLIEADAPLIAALNARIKATEAGRIVRERASTMPAHFPKLVIEHTGGTEHTNPPSVFGQKDGGASVVDYGVPMTRRFAIRIVYDRVGLDVQTPTEAMLRRALMTGGRTLGLSWVTNVSMSAERRDLSNELTGGQKRPVLSLNLTVDIRPALSLLTA